MRPGGSARPVSARSPTASRTIRVPAHVHERRAKLARLGREFEVEHGREPTQEELATLSGYEQQHVEEALGAVEASVSLNQAVGEDGDGELGDLFADRDAVDPAEEAGDALRRQSVRTALETLPERERRILELRFGFDGEQQSLDAIAREVGVSRERVRQLEQRALAMLATELEGIVAVPAEDLGWVCLITQRPRRAVCLVSIVALSSRVGPKSTR